MSQGQYFYLSEGQCLKVNNSTYLKGNCSACLKGKGLFHLDIYRLCVSVRVACSHQRDSLSRPLSFSSCHGIEGQLFCLSEGQCLKVNGYTYLKGNHSVYLKGNYSVYLKSNVARSIILLI